MVILAVDPGPKESGFVFWDVPNAGMIRCGTMPNDVVYRLVKEQGYSMLAIENIRGYGIVAGDDTFDTCIWIGRFDHERKAMLIGRKDIKRHLCGTTTTNDKYIRQALIDRLGEQGTKKAPGPLFGIAGHTWAALAVAITAADKIKEKENSQCSIR
jgi:hypothetical protein